MTEDHGMRQVVVPPHLWPVVKGAVERVGYIVAQLPDIYTDDDDLPTYVLHPRPDGW